MVHQYKLNGYNIVLDTCSGSIHSVDDLAYDVIGMIREYTQGDIIDAMRRNVLTMWWHSDGQASCLRPIIMNIWRMISRREIR